MYHKSTRHDELVALTHRHIGVVPAALVVAPVPVGPAAPWVYFTQAMRIFGRILGHEHQPWTRKQVLEHYKGTLRHRYTQAAKDLDDHPVRKEDAHIGAFCKPEKWTPEKHATRAPRMIQARDPKYGFELAKYLKPIEHKLYKLCDKKRKHGLPATRMVLKGLSQVDRAKLIKRKWNQFKDPVAVPLDGSSWDGHVDLPVLQEEHKLYLHCHRFNPKLAQLLRWQLNNTCTTACGIHYTVRGRRMSGDMNTASGNTVLMCAMVVGLMRMLAITKYELADDGDDCFVLIERKDLAAFQRSVTPYFLALGQEVKVEAPCTSLEDIEFCQSKFIATSPPQMIRNPHKVLSSVPCSYRHFDNPKGTWRIFKAIIQCEEVLNRGVPILQPWVRAWLKKLDPIKAAKLEKNEASWFRAQVELKHSINSEITTEARQSFERAFGVCVEQQRLIEARLIAAVEAHNLESDRPQPLDIWFEGLQFDIMEGLPQHI